MADDSLSNFYYFRADAPLHYVPDATEFKALSRLAQTLRGLNLETCMPKPIDGVAIRFRNDELQSSLNNQLLSSLPCKEREDIFSAFSYNGYAAHHTHGKTIISVDAHRLKRGHNIGSLYHEAGHIAAGDLHLDSLTNMPAILDCLELCRNFLTDDPVHLTHTVTDIFGSVEQFAKDIATIETLAEPLATLQHHPIYQTRDARALAETFSNDPSYEADIQAHLATIPDCSDEQADRFRLLAKKLDGKSYPSRAPADPRVMELLGSEVISSLLDQSSTFQDFAFTYFKAREYRADEFVIKHASHPKLFFKNFEAINAAFQRAEKVRPGVIAEYSANAVNYPTHKERVDYMRDVAKKAGISLD